MTDNEEPKGISRRTVTKAMAWAVPAIAVAAPVAAYAASGKGPIIVPGVACKAPGNSCNPIVKGYSVPASINNPGKDTIWITAVSININTSGITFGVNPIPALPWKIDPGQTINVNFNAMSGNSANLAFQLGFLSTWGHAADGSDLEHDPAQLTVTVAQTPPDCCK